MRQGFGVSVCALALTLISAAAMAESPASSVSSPIAASSSQHENRPNVLVWMLDDVGFAQFACFGGLIETPNIDRVARMGLRYSNYRTTPICSASRASFLSGRMPHSVNIGGHAAAGRDQLGQNGHIPTAAGSIAANLKAAGYATFALGKWDHLPSKEISPAGPFNQWPLGQGFERFYGFMAADADHWNPTLVNDATPIATPDRSDYHLSEDLADKAIAMIDARHARDPQRPFFMYWATGAGHAPNHAPQSWIDHYRGRFDMGYDKARAAILKKQVAQGLIPAGTKLFPLPEDLPRWQTLSADQKRLYARQMEVFAAQLTHADEQFGRILDALETSGELDNTIVIVTSDNGASAGAGADGAVNESRLIAGGLYAAAENMPFLDRWGGPETYPHYAGGWTVAGNTPFRYYKQTTYEGGTRVPLVIAWPRGIAARGGVRKDFVHVSDIAPTILDASNTPSAEVLNNTRQTPMEGRSITGTFAGKPLEQRPQYSEMYGNKGLWWQDWSIVTNHRFKMWDKQTSGALDEPWELYDLKHDPGQTRDLATRYPDRVATMAKLFDEQAKRYNVYPIFDLYSRDPQAARRAEDEFVRRKGKWHYTGLVGNIVGPLAPPILFRTYRMKANLDLSANRVTGPIFAYGGHLGGLALYLRAGVPVFVANTFEGESLEIASSQGISAGKHVVELDFQRAAVAPLEKGEHNVVIRVDGNIVARSSLNYAIPASFGVPETFGIGIDNGSPVLLGARADIPLAGTIFDLIFEF